VRRRCTLPLWLCLAALLAACAAPAASPSATPTAAQAIEQFQSAVALPASPVEFVETTAMINSPAGNLSVDIYQDQSGRKFSFDPVTNQVVELDARSLLSSLSPNADALSLAKLREKAQTLALAYTPNLASLDLTYTENQKGDLYFFDWRGQRTGNNVNGPFVQVALHTSGDLIAYYNTLGVN
jgi:hypothetical protein